MPPFLLNLAWGLTSLLALAGFGRLALRLLHPNSPHPQAWLLAPAAGIATLSLLGSLLNLASLASRPILITLVPLGILLALIQTVPALRSASKNFQRWPGRADAPFLLLALILTTGLSLRFAASTTVASFANVTFDTYRVDSLYQGQRLHSLDDMQSYLVSVERLLTTGSLGHDPFNSRLMMSSLGTQHLLNALAIAPLADDNVHMAEGGIALAALVFAAIALGLNLQLFRRTATALGIIPLLLLWRFLNISADVSAAAALTALAAVAAESLPTTFPFRRTLLFAFLLASACSLKTTIIPPAVAFITLTLLARALFERRPRLLLTLPLLAFFTALFLLPWMLWQHANSGTFLYPLVGQGNHYLTYFPPPRPAIPFAQTAALLTLQQGLLLPATFLILFFATLAWPRSRPWLSVADAALLLAFLVAWFTAWFTIAPSTQTPDVDRYISPIRAVGLITAFALFWKIAAAAARSSPPSPRLAKTILLLSALALLIGTAPEWANTWFRFVPRDLQSSLEAARIVRGPNNDNSLQTQTRQLQSAIPPNEKLLVYLTTPAFLDFNRNPICVIDWPGESSPPPGMPLYSGPEPLRAYLEHLGIHYLAYSYKTFASFSPKEYGWYDAPAAGAVLRRQAVNSFAFQADLAALIKSSRHLYDNGSDILLDLSQPPAPAPAPAPATPSP